MYKYTLAGDVNGFDIMKTLEIIKQEMEWKKYKTKSRVGAVVAAAAVAEWQKDTNWGAKPWSHSVGRYCLSWIFLRFLSPCIIAFNLSYILAVSSHCVKIGINRKTFV